MHISSLYSGERENGERLALREQKKESVWLSENVFVFGNNFIFNKRLIISKDLRLHEKCVGELWEESKVYSIIFQYFSAEIMQIRNKTWTTNNWKSTPRNSSIRRSDTTSHLGLQVLKHLWTNICISWQNINHITLLHWSFSVCPLVQNRLALWEVTALVLL